jgi:endoglucanase
MGACGHSWVIGFGRNPPQRPHHRDSALHMHESGDWEAFKRSGPNPNQLIGGLCGGPLEDGQWEDDREDYIANEVALDYNAALLIGTILSLRTLKAE